MIIKQTKLLELLLVLLSTNSMFAMGTLRTRLHVAANHNEIELVKAFISAGDNVNAKDLYGYMPLHVLSQTTFLGDTAIVLIESGADVEAKNRYGQTPLDIATHGMNPSMQKALITTVSHREIQQELTTVVAKKMVLARKYLEVSQLYGLEQEIAQSFERVKSKELNLRSPL